jgi:penicillin-binding protein 1A
MEAAKPTRKNRKLTPKLRPASAGPLTPEEKKRRRKKLILKILLWSGVGLVALLAVFSAVIAIMFWYYGRDPNLPSVDALEHYEPKQVTRILDRDGGLIGEVYAERRTYVPYDKFPKVVVDAFVAAEDGDFWDHGGISYTGMVRALFSNLKSGKKGQGASTITQQVIKNMLLTPERTMRRKFQEIILARRLEKRLSKQQILTLYLNHIYFGGGRYGVVEAARYYFDKELAELTVAEAAYLAAIPKSPEHLDAHDPDNQAYAKERQGYVLGEMLRHGYISADEATKLKKETIRIVEADDPTARAPEWLTVVRAKLVEEYGEPALGTLGATVVSTRDAEIEEQAREALRAGLRAYDDRHDVGRALDGRKIKPDKRPR